MANKVTAAPDFPKVFSAASLESIASFLGNLTRSLFTTLRQHAIRLNLSITADGTDAMQAPLPLASYTVLTVPVASTWTGGVIFVSNEAGGATMAFSDGTNWRRVQDRAIVS